MRDAKNDKDGWLPSSTAEAAKVVGAYALFGGLWILFSDRLLLSLSPDTAFYHSFQTYKGWFYVGATAILLYFLIRRSIERTRLLEEEKRQSELKLLQAQKMEIVGRLAGGIAHDFNNILTAIMSLSQLTAKSLPEGDPRRADVEDITRFSEKAAAITRQLLVFSRKREFQPRPLDPGETLRNAGSMLRRASGEKIKLEIGAGPGLRHINADPGQLEQALMNLAVNARDAMPEGGTLELSAANAGLKEPLAALGRELPPGDYVVLSVRDSGVGMDRATLGRLFEPFFTTKPEGKGTGLGLSMVHGLVKESGGGITVKSAPGAGTVFTLYFPALAEASAASPAAAPTPAPARAAEKERPFLLKPFPAEVFLEKVREAAGRKDG